MNIASASWGKKMDSRELSKLSDFLKVVADENRLKILYFIRDGEKCVCEIWQFLNLPQNLTSHHLKVMKNSNLILSRKEGTKVFYKLNGGFIRNHLELLDNFLS